jgi:hypothetical protein
MSALLSIVLSAFSVFAPHSNFYNFNIDTGIASGPDYTTVHTTSTVYGLNTD